VRHLQAVDVSVQADSNVTASVAQTSVMPMVIAAVEHQRPAERRVLVDSLALRTLPAPMRPLLRQRAVGRWLTTTMDRRAPGIWNSLACRKRYFDDVVGASARDGIQALVVLGAGLDTKAVRLAAPAGLPSFEVDLPVNIAAKRRRIRLPDNVIQVPLDFEHDDLGATLIEHGYDADARTMFVWEGVTQYLTEAAVRRVFKVLAKAPADSRLAFSYVCKDFLDGVDFHGSEQTYRRFVANGPIWRFGLQPSDVPALLAEYGWREHEQVGPQEYTARYLDPAGRTTTVTGLERCVCADKD
jgi:methyltransferase (TIGR00027 family)